MARTARKPRPAPKARTTSRTRAASKIRAAFKPRATSKNKAGVTLDIRIESDLWKRVRDVKALARRAIVAAASAAAGSRCELAVLLTDDPSIRVINADWRGVDAPTNVLSFPAPQSEGDRPFLGDIVLAFETIALEARAEGKPFAHHFAHLCVHGFLHLLGYDHVRKKDAEVMEAAERAILRRLLIPDPYG
jgi:probable rRNA maturation factor